MIRSKYSLLEALNFSQEPIYHFTTLKAADKILSTGIFYPSYVHIQGDQGRTRRFISFTRNPDFLDGYPYNSKKRQLKPERSKTYGDEQYKKKDLIATVRFTIDTEKLETLVQQVTGNPSAEPFEFPIDLLGQGFKPEEEERLWMKLREVKNFPDCITHLCFYSIPSGSRKMHNIAVRIYENAKSRGIPCTKISDGFKGEDPVNKFNLENLFVDSYTTGLAGREEEASEADYEKLAEAVAVCALDFRKDRHRLVDYVDRKFGKLLDDSYEFRLTVERKISEFVENPREMNRIKSNFRFLATKETKLPVNVQQAFFQMLDRTLIRTKTSNFGQLVSLRQQELQNGNLSEQFNLRLYLQNNWLLQESKES